MAIVVSALMANVQAQQSASFIESTVSKSNPFVQEAIKYTLHFWRHSHLQQGHFVKPDIPDAILLDGEEHTVKTVRKNDQTYELLEQTYFLIPQKSGEIKLPGPVFSSREFFVKGKSLSLYVRPQPENFSGQNWLIARSIHFEQSWTNPKILQAGVPVERTITLSGTGVLGAQLPHRQLLPDTALSDENISEKGFVTVQKFFDNSHHSIKNGELYGQRIIKLRYVATQSGQLLIPDIQLKWWHGQTGNIKNERIPGKSFTVVSQDHQAIEKQSKQQKHSNKESRNVSAPGLTIKHRLLKTGRYLNNLWQKQSLSIILVVTVFLVVIALMKFFKYAFKSGKMIYWQLLLNKYQVYKLQRSLVQACQQNDCYRVKSVLLAWAKILYPEQRYENLLALSDSTNNSAEKKALRYIDRCLYGHQERIRIDVAIQSGLMRFMSRSMSKSTHKNKRGHLPRMWQDDSELS